MSTIQRKIVLVDLQYPYGKKNPYMSGSLCAIAAVLMAMGNKVTLLDFNIDDPDDPEVLRQILEAGLVGISVIGSAYIPSAIAFVRKFASKTIMVGRQVVAKLSREHFGKLFAIPLVDQVPLLAAVAERAEAHDGGALAAIGADAIVGDPVGSGLSQLEAKLPSLKRLPCGLR